MPEQTAHTLTKAELADALFEQIGLTKRESKQTVDVFFALISERLAAGEEVKLTGFGNFNTHMKAPRPGCNLHTGETVPIAARRVVTFHASQRLKEAVQQAQSLSQKSSQQPDHAPNARNLDKCFG